MKTVWTYRFSLFFSTFLFLLSASLHSASAQDFNEGAYTISCGEKVSLEDSGENYLISLKGSFELGTSPFGRPAGFFHHYQVAVIDSHSPERALISSGPHTLLSDRAFRSTENDHIQFWLSGQRQGEAEFKIILPAKIKNIESIPSAEASALFEAAITIEMKMLDSPSLKIPLTCQFHKQP